MRTGCWLSASTKVGVNGGRAARGDAATAQSAGDALAVLSCHDDAGGTIIERHCSEAFDVARTGAAAATETAAKGAAATGAAATRAEAATTAGRSGAHAHSGKRSASGTH